MGLIEYREKWTSWDGSENPRESLLPAGPQSHLSTAAEQSLPKGFYASHSLQKKKKRRLDSHLGGIQRNQIAYYPTSVITWFDK